MRCDSLPRLVEKQARLWENLETPIEKVLKWFYGNSLAWITSQDQDVAPPPSSKLPNTWRALLKPGVLFVGQVARFLTSVFRRHSTFYLKGSRTKVRRALSVGQTLLMLKKGSPVVSKALVQEAQKKHKVAMSAASKGRHEPPKLSEDLKSQITDDLLYKTIDLVVEEAFPPTMSRRIRREGRDPSMKLAPFPSLSAHFGSKRDEGGAVQKISSLWQRAIGGADHYDDGPFLDLIDARVEELLKFQKVFTDDSPEEFANVTSAAIGDIPQGIDSLERELAWLRSIRTEFKGRVLRLNRRLKGKDWSPDPENAQEVFWDLVQEELEKEDFRVSPVYLREPLKVRTITKGPEVAYWVLRDVQRLLWRTLKDHPTFQLIGTPLSGEILDGLKSRVVDQGGAWLSGDYSAATDNLRKNLTVHAWRSVCERCGFPSWIRKVGEKALVEHVVVYKDETIVQQNGQLMGSVLSFPILCIINAALCRLPFDLNTKRPEPTPNPWIQWRAERGMSSQGAPLEMRNWADYGEESLFQTRKPLRDLPILVNGDDCVMRYRKWQRELWSYAATRAGMEPSPGKCYYSKRWLQMNSDLYVDGAAGFERIPFLNFSLASTVKAKGGGKRGLNALGSSAREFVMGWKGDKRRRVLSIWIRRMSPILKKVIPDGMSWGLPEWFGGVGLPYDLADVAQSVSPFQMAIASYALLKLQTEGRTVQILPGEESSAPAWIQNALRKAQLFSRTELCEDESVPMPGYLPDASSSFTPFLWLAAVDPREENVCKRERSARRNFQRVVKSVVRAQQDGLQLASIEDLMRFKRVKSSVPEWVSSVLDRTVDAPRNVLAELLARSSKEQGTSL